jgi:hypothetical protein
MQVRKMVAGSVLGLGMTAMAVGGAGSALASPSDGPQWGNGHPVQNITKTINQIGTVNGNHVSLFSGNSLTLNVGNGNFSNNLINTGAGSFNTSNTTVVVHHHKPYNHNGSN